MKLKNGWTKRDKTTYRHHLYGSIVINEDNTVFATDYNGITIGFGYKPLKQTMKYLQDEYLNSCEF